MEYTKKVQETPNSKFLVPINDIAVMVVASNCSLKRAVTFDKEDAQMLKAGEESSQILYLTKEDIKALYELAEI